MVIACYIPGCCDIQVTFRLHCTRTCERYRNILPCWLGFGAWVSRSPDIPRGTEVFSHRAPPPALYFFTTCQLVCLALLRRVSQTFAQCDLQ